MTENVTTDIEANWPQWLKEADTSNAQVEIKNGTVVWRGGTWRGGTWRGGEWHGGTWLGGTWYGNKWYDGFKVDAAPIVGESE